MDSSVRAARQRWHDRATSDDGSAQPFVIGVAASFTPQPLEPFIGAELLDGARAPQIVFADHNQLHQACLDPISTFGGRPDRLVLLWRLEDVFETDLLAIAEGDAPAGERLLEGVAQLTGLIKQCAEREYLATVVGIPPAPSGFGLDPFDVASSTVLSDLHARAVAIVIDALASVDAIRFVDHRRILEQVGAADAHDGRGTLLYRQPYRSSFCHALGTEVARVIASFDQPAPKVVVIDADNTLWGGIVGEDGVSGIAIGGAFPGNAFADFQRGLRRLARRGVLVALCSKNNPDDVDSVFAGRAEMVLQPDDFAATRVSWDAKSVGVSSIATELNVGLDSVVFIDDSEYELAEVSAALPQVRCLQVPEELSDLPDLLTRTGWFRYQRVSSEDGQRTRMVRQEKDRVAAQTGLAPEAFLASLELRVAFATADSSHVGRVTQLINKTNQFNLTTRRRTEAEVAAIVDAADHRTYVIDVRDRFGAYGLVGVAIVSGVGSSTWELDTLLMSCRVLRRGVETAFLAALARTARIGGAERLVGHFVPSAKNEQVRDLYSDHGFQADPSGAFVFTLSDPIAVPSHISLVDDA